MTTYIKVIIYDEEGNILEGHAQIRALSKNQDGELDLSELEDLLQKIIQAAR